MRDLTMIDTAEFWRRGPEYAHGDVRTEDVATEVFVFPAAAPVQKDGSFTNTGCVLQWRDRAVDPPGDARSDLWFAPAGAARGVPAPAEPDRTGPH